MTEVVAFHGGPFAGKTRQLPVLYPRAYRTVHRVRIPVLTRSGLGEYIGVYDRLGRTRDFRWRQPCRRWPEVGSI